jgi:lipopolysaccharide export system protein LptA
MIGNVVVTRGQNRLTGARGKVDLTTKKSTLLGAGGAAVNPQSNNGQPGTTKSSDGRVRGVFFPE